MSKTIEVDLANLVYPQFQDQMPELFDKIIGFQIIESKNDNKNITGMVVVNINGKYFYVPIFFNNGILKPFTHLLDLEKKRFIPATSDVIRFLLKPSKSMSVKVVPRTENSTIVSSPNMANFILNPMLNKISKAKELLNYFMKKNGSLAIIETPSSEFNTKVNDLLYNNNIIIEDTRKETSEVLPVEYPQQFRSITCCGVYSIVMIDGSLKKFVVLPHLIGFCGEYSYILLYDPETGDISTVSCNILGKLLSKDIWSELKPADNIVLDNYYIFVSKNGKKSTEPMRIHQRYINKNGYTTYVTCCGKVITVKPFGEDCIVPLQGQDEIVLSKDIVPVKVKEVFFDVKIFGNLASLTDFMKKMNVEEVEINKEAFEYSISKNNYIIKRGNYKDCLIYLLKDLNLKKEASKKMLDNTGKYYLLNKKAISEALYETPHWQINNRLLPSYTSYPVPTDEYYTQQNNSIRNVEQDINFLLNAAKIGDENIFDASVLAVIGNNSNEKIKEIIPVLNEATHLVGTLLYSLWSSSDLYKDSFTEDELYELEQNLMEVFKKLGDTSLKIVLRKKLYYND